MLWWALTKGYGSGTWRKHSRSIVRITAERSIPDFWLAPISIEYILTSLQLFAGLAFRGFYWFCLWSVWKTTSCHMHDMIDHWLKGELPMCTDSKGKNHTSPIGGLVSHTIHQHSSPIFQTWLNSAASEQFKRFNMPFFIHLYHHHSSSHLSDFWSCCQNVIVGDSSMPEIVDLKTA